MNTRIDLARLDCRSCTCNHPISMHVRRGCIGYDATADRRCACASSADRIRQMNPPSYWEPGA